MSQQKRKRSRGLIFTDEGLQKLQSTIRSHQSKYKFKKKYTFEEFSEITGLAYNTVFKVLKRKKGVDKQTLVKFFMAFDLELTANDYASSDSLPQNNMQYSNSNTCTIESVNWNDGIDKSNLYGRTTELAILKKWLVEDCCRLITIYGMGGIGKTALAVELIKEIKHEFNYVFHRSLQEPPLLKSALTDLIQFLSNKQESETNISNSIRESFSELINYLRSHRCLIVLDDVETIMQKGVYSGHYQDIYRNYGQLIRYIGEVSHQSSFLLITRELPKEVAILEGETLPIHFMKLNGLQQLEGQKILQEQNLFGTLSHQNELIESYSGNPLAIKKVAKIIQDNYKSNIDEFLQQDQHFCDDLKQLLSQHYQRLSSLEKKVCRQLVFSSKPMSILQIQKQLSSSISASEIMIILESLIKRSLIFNKNGLFACEPLFCKYFL